MSDSDKEERVDEVTENGEQDAADEVDASPPPGPRFSFIDFWPKCLEKGGLMKAPVFESFSVLVERANVFLRINTEWEVINCESVERKQDADDEEIDAETMTYKEDPKSVKCFVTGLRLWVCPRYPTEPAQQIGYLNIVPNSIKQAAGSEFPTFETFSATIRRLNGLLQNDPIQGKIVTVETRDIKYREKWTADGIDPDQSSWFQIGRNTLYVFTIRVFYEVGQPANEQIGFQDFLPDKTGTEKVKRVTFPTFSNFSSIVTKSQAWLKDKKNVRVTNVQTLQRKTKKDSDVDLDQTFFVDDTKISKLFISSLRIGYATSENTENDSDMILKQKTIYPEMLIVSRRRSSIKDYRYKTLTETVERALPWFKENTSSRIISLETVMAPLDKDGTKEPHRQTCNRFLTRHMWFQTYLRVYYDGAIDEPDSDDSDDQKKDESEGKSKDECVIS